MTSESTKNESPDIFNKKPSVKSYISQSEDSYKKITNEYEICSTSTLHKIAKLESKFNIHFGTPNDKILTPTAISANSFDHIPPKSKFFRLPAISMTDKKLTRNNSEAKIFRDVSYRMEPSISETVEKNEDINKNELVQVLCNKDPSSNFNFPITIEELREIKDSLENTNNNLTLKSEKFEKYIPSEFYIKKGKDSLFVNLLKNTKDISKLSRKNLGVPSSRNDAITLLNWFEKMYDLLTSSSENMKEIEKFELTQTLYTIAFSETVRQITVQCLERGIVMQKIWQAYMQFIEQIAQQFRDKTQKNKKKIDDKIERLHKFYEKDIEATREDALLARQEMKETQKENEYLKNELAYQTKILKNTEEMLENERNTSLFLTRKYESLDDSFQDISKEFSRLQQNYKELQDNVEFYKQKNLELIREINAKKQAPIGIRPGLESQINPVEFLSVKRFPILTLEKCPIPKKGQIIITDSTLRVISIPNLKYPYLRGAQLDAFLKEKKEKSRNKKYNLKIYFKTAELSEEFKQTKIKLIEKLDPEISEGEKTSENNEEVKLANIEKSQNDTEKSEKINLNSVKSSRNQDLSVKNSKVAKTEITSIHRSETTIKNNIKTHLKLELKNLWNINILPQKTYDIMNISDNLIGNIETNSIKMQENSIKIQEDSIKIQENSIKSKENSIQIYENCENEIIKECDNENLDKSIETQRNPDENKQNEIKVIVKKKESAKQPEETKKSDKKSDKKLKKKLKDKVKQIIKSERNSKINIHKSEKINTNLPSHKQSLSGDYKYEFSQKEKGISISTQTEKIIEQVFKTEVKIVKKVEIPQEENISKNLIETPCQTEDIILNISESISQRQEKADLIIEFLQKSIQTDLPIFSEFFTNTEYHIIPPTSSQNQLDLQKAKNTILIKDTHNLSSMNSQKPTMKKSKTMIIDKNLSPVTEENDLKIEEPIIPLKPINPTKISPSQIIQTFEELHFDNPINNQEKTPKGKIKTNIEILSKVDDQKNEIATIENEHKAPKMLTKKSSKNLDITIPNEIIEKYQKENLELKKENSTLKEKFDNLFNNLKTQIAEISSSVPENQQKSDKIEELVKTIENTKKDIYTCPNKYQINPRVSNLLKRLMDKSHIKRKINQNSLNSNISQELSKVMQNYNSQSDTEKFKIDPLPKKMLLKLITGYYYEFLQRKNMEIYDLATYIYDDLGKKFGLKTVADRKYLQVFFLI